MFYWIFSKSFGDDNIQKEDTRDPRVKYGLKVVYLGLLLYFYQYEIRSLILYKAEYFKKYWKIVDILYLILLPIIAAFDLA